MSIRTKSPFHPLLLIVLGVGATLAAAVGLRAQDVLFVVDAANRPAERVLRIDPYSSDSEVVWRGGGDLDIAVSPDLNRLYVNHLHGAGHGHKLTAVDLPTGTKLTTVDTPNRARWTVMTEPIMKLSADGRWLYTLNLYSSETAEEYTIGVFDTDFSRFLGEEIAVGECSAAQLWPLNEATELLVLCRGTGVIHSLQFSSDGAVEKHETVQVPPPPVKPAPGPRVGRKDSGEVIMEAALDRDRGALYLAKRNGRFWKLNTADLSLSEVAIEGTREGAAVAHFHAAQFGARRWHLKFSLPVDYDVMVAIQGIVDLESRTLKFAQIGKKGGPRKALMPGGEYVYVTNPNSEGIHVLDAATAEPVTVIDSVRKPAFVIRGTRG